MVIIYRKIQNEGEFNVTMSQKEAMDIVALLTKALMGDMAELLPIALITSPTLESANEFVLGTFGKAENAIPVMALATQVMLQANRERFEHET